MLHVCCMAGNIGSLQHFVEAVNYVIEWILEPEEASDGIIDLLQDLLALPS